MLCFNCHYNPATEKFSGRLLTEVSQFGKIYSANITQDKNAGIGGWPDGQISYFIRTGLKSTGEYVPRICLNSLILLMKICIPSLPFCDLMIPGWRLTLLHLKKIVRSFLTKFLFTIKAFKHFDFPKETILLPDTTNKVAWGKYITLYQYECYSCHSKDFAKNNYNFPGKSSGFLETEMKCTR